MKTISIIYADKRKERVELGEKVGGGGAGDVYRVRDRPDEVIKVYKEGQRADYSAKIWAMLSVKPDLGDVDMG